MFILSKHVILFFSFFSFRSFTYSVWFVTCHFDLFRFNVIRTSIDHIQFTLNMVYVRVRVRARALSSLCTSVFVFLFVWFLSTFSIILIQKRKSKIYCLVKMRRRMFFFKKKREQKRVAVSGWFLVVAFSFCSCSPSFSSAQCATIISHTNHAAH